MGPFAMTGAGSVEAGSGPVHGNHGHGTTFFSPFSLPMHKNEHGQVEVWELEWQKKTDSANMKTGRVTFVLLTGLLIDRCRRHLQENVVGGLQCVELFPVETMVLIAALEIVVAIASICMLVCNWRRPEDKTLYGSMLIMWYVFVTVQALPPFSPSCSKYAKTYISNQEKPCDKDWMEKIFVSLINMDCTMQGPTITQILMIWILCSYFFIPAYRWMSWNWVYLFLFYLPLNFIMDYNSQEAHYEPWDVLFSTMILSMCQAIASARKFFLEKSQRTKAKLDFFDKLQARAMLLSLRDQLPEHVLSPLLANPGQPYAHHIQCVSILFIMIHDFDAKARAVDVKQLLEFLNETFSAWDDIMLEMKVTIIETVREEYVCAVGVLPDQETYGVERHNVILRRLLLAAVKILEGQTAEVQVKMGIHTGEIFTGVIGKKLPRFRLFGDVINTTARMMQKSPVGMLQFGEETHRYIDGQMMLPPHVTITEEKGVFMKGKGNIDVYRLGLDKGSDESGGSEGRGGQGRSKRSFSCALVGAARPTIFIPAQPKRLASGRRVSTRPSGMKSKQSVSALDFALGRMRLPGVGGFGGGLAAMGSMVDTLSARLKRDKQEDGGLVRARRSMQAAMGGGPNLVGKRRTQMTMKLLPRVAEADSVVSKQSTEGVGILKSQSVRRTETRNKSGGKRGGGLRFNDHDEVVEVEARRFSLSRGFSNLDGLAVVTGISTNADESSGDDMPQCMSEELSNPTESLSSVSAINSYFSECTDTGTSPADGGENTTEEEEEEQRLTDLMKEISKARRRNLAFWKKVVSFGLRTGYFNDETEREWYTWQHCNLMCHKLKGRLHRHQMTMMFVSVFDCALFCHFFSGFSAPFTPHRLYGALPGVRLPVFLCSRLLCYLILAFWKDQVGDDFRAEPQAGSPRKVSWVVRRAHHAQFGLLVSYHLIVVLLLISYDAVSNVQENWIDNLMARWGTKRGDDLLQSAFHERLNNHWRQSSINAFFAVLAVYLVATSHPWPFLYCMTFPLNLLLLARVYKSPFWTRNGHSIVSLYYSETGWLIMFSVFALLFSRTSFLLERDSRGRFKSLKNLEATRSRFEDILSRLMPEKILEEMNDAPPGEKFPSHPYKCCTVVQSDLSGFTALASTRKPAEVVELVSDLFGRFDVDADRRGVWKVETVGDAYIAAAAEAPLTASCLAINVVAFGQDMIRQVHAWAISNRIRVTCRVGCHHGECIGGIASSHMRRYHLFGDLMGVVEVLESTGLLSRVQISVACMRKVEHELLTEGPLECEMEIRGFRLREDDVLKTSKGDEHSYDEVGGRTYIVNFRDELPEEPDVDVS